MGATPRPAHFPRNVWWRVPRAERAFVAWCSAGDDAATHAFDWRVFANYAESRTRRRRRLLHLDHETPQQEEARLARRHRLEERMRGHKAGSCKASRLHAKGAY